MDRHSPATSSRESANAGDLVGADRLFKFLRFCHIFSSAVREILEAKYLEEASRNPVTLSQFHLLRLVTLNGSHQVNEVAEFLGVSSPAVSKSIHKLERQGLVNRMPSRNDRRATLLEASERGRRLVRRYDELKAARLAPVLEKFEPEELEQLTRLLERFAIQLFRVEDSEHKYCLRCAAYCEEDCPIAVILDSCPYKMIKDRSRAPSMPGQETS